MSDTTRFLDEKLIDELFEELNEESMLISDASCSGGGGGICGTLPNLPKYNFTW